jgi:hypothetical protein
MLDCNDYGIILDLSAGQLLCVALRGYGYKDTLQFRSEFGLLSWSSGRVGKDTIFTQHTK